MLNRVWRADSPLLPPKKAAALVRRGTRGAGALTYPWAAATHPDPTGSRFRVLRAALLKYDRLEGLFLDQSCARHTALLRASPAPPLPSSFLRDAGRPLPAPKRPAADRERGGFQGPWGSIEAEADQIEGKLAQMSPHETKTSQN